MRAQVGRTTALITALAVAGLAGCRASGLFETDAPKPQAPADQHCATPVSGITGTIAFMSDRTGNYDIFTMNADGSGVTQLTHDPNTDDHPAWSPDGTKIAFTRENIFGRDIFVMNADGSGVAQLTDDLADDHEMAWSPDGTRIAFASNRTGNYDIFVMNADGNGVNQLTHDPTDDREPAWSPDGTKIAFSSGGIRHRSSGSMNDNYDLFVMNADGTETKKLTGGRADDQNPAWSPDGTKIAWRIDRHGAGKLAVMNADGTGVTDLASESGILGSSPDWSPDGYPTWSPDGTKIAVSSRRTGTIEIFLMNADGCGAINLTNHSAVDDEPAWRPHTPPAPAPASPAPAPAVLPHTT